MDSGQGRDRVLVARQTAAFALATGVVLYYALRAGSYDIVVRQAEALVLWFLLLLGYALGLFPRARFPGGWLLVIGAFVALTLWTAVSLTWSESAERTLAEVARVAHLAGIVLLAWGLLDRDTWRPAAAGLAFAAVVICGLAVASRLAPGSFPENSVKRAFGTRRLSYPFYYWNAVGAWSAMSIAMALAWSAHARLLLVRVAFAATLPVCALAVYLTYSRAGVAGSAFAVVCVIALSRNRWMAAVHALAAAGGSALVIFQVRDHDAIANAASEATGAGAVVEMLVVGAAIATAATLATRLGRGDRWRLPRSAGRAIAAAGVVVAAIVLVAGFRDEVEEGWDQFRGASVVPTQAGEEGDPAARLTNLSGARYDHWRSALNAFEEDPLTGLGAGTFEFWWNQEGGLQYVLDAHSLYLEHLAELGLPGLLLLLAALGALGTLAALARAHVEDPADAGAVAACLTAFLVFLVHAGVDWMWESTAVAALGIGAVTVAACARSGDRAPLAAPIRTGLALLALLALLVQLPGLVSTSRVRDSNSAFRAGDLEGALTNATEAADAEPWAAAPLIQRALVEEAAGRLDAAAVDVRRAVEREPTNWRHRVVLARIEARRGNVEAALEEFRTGKRLRPAARVFEAPPR
jgi:tetratricopeptide (TPR) repeat protein